MHFIGRKTELEELEDLFKKSSASLVVIRGRRRIGKSRLIQEFTKGVKCWNFSGYPPVEKTSKETQIDLFSQQLSKNLSMPKFQVSEWSDLFWYLGDKASKGKIVIVFDEISWMGSKDPDFLGHLKNAWDMHFSKNSKLMLILCGSISSWIEKNILSSTGFLGRVSFDKIVKELPLQDCQEFWGGKKEYISAYEKCRVLSVTGGVPKYLEEIIPQKTAEENIGRLCFKPEGILYREYDQIFSDLFSKRAPLYSQIVQYLAEGSSDLDNICRALNFEKGGTVSGYLKDLILAGFVKEDFNWNILTDKISTLKKFRLSDNYLRFYVKYILPNKEQISRGEFAFDPVESLPAWEITMGFQFENLILNNLGAIYAKLGLRFGSVKMAGPFFQRKNERQQGCQIDLLIQGKNDSLYVCEVKFYLAKVGMAVVHDMEKKISRLSRPKGKSVRTVLIHVNGVTKGVIESQFFDYIIDFSELFEE